MNLSAEYRDFTVTLAEASAALRRDGVAVVPAVPRDRLPALRDGMWRTFETLTDGRLRRGDASTYGALFDLFPIHSMLVQHYGVGHAQYVWDVRSSPGVTGAFSRLWGTDDLITSFDGVSLHLPHEATKRGFYRGGTHDWFHCDQRSSRSRLVSIQGVVNLYDVNAGDATTRVLTGSHALHGEYMEHFGVETGTKDWHKFPAETAAEHLKFFTDRGCEKACVLARAGDLVLWDSRTMHHGVESQRGRAAANTRAGVYVCMVPRAAAAPAVLTKRKRLFDEMRMTSHLPQQSNVFGKMPRTYGKSVPRLRPVPPPVLSAAGRALI